MRANIYFIDISWGYGFWRVSIRAGLFGFDWLVFENDGGCSGRLHLLRVFLTANYGLITSNNSIPLTRWLFGMVGGVILSVIAVALFFYGFP